MYKILHIPTAFIIGELNWLFPYVGYRVIRGPHIEDDFYALNEVVFETVKEAKRYIKDNTKFIQYKNTIILYNKKQPFKKINKNHLEILKVNDV